MRARYIRSLPYMVQMHTSMYANSNEMRAMSSLITSTITIHNSWPVNIACCKNELWQIQVLKYRLCCRVNKLEPLLICCYSLPRGNTINKYNMIIQIADIYCTQSRQKGVLYESIICWNVAVTIGAMCDKYCFLFHDH